MPNEEIQRLRGDLTTMRQVMRLDRPYDAGDIPSLLMLGLGGLIAVPLLELTSWHQRLTLILALLPGAIVYAHRYITVKKKRTERPALWKEYRGSLLGGILIALLAAGWMWWSQQHLSTTREAAGAPTMFCIGVVLVGFGVFDPNRRNYLFSGISLIAFAFAIPWLTPHQIAPVGAGALAFAMLSTATFIWWQTRNDALH
jgi:hypothetical protein